MLLRVLVEVGTKRDSVVWSAWHRGQFLSLSGSLPTERPPRQRATAQDGLEIHEKCGRKEAPKRRNRFFKLESDVRGRRRG